MTHRREPRRGAHARPTRRVIRGFVRRYGWRAYALPILATVTLAVAVQSDPGAGRADAQEDTAAHALGRGSAAGFAQFRPGITPKPVTVRHTTESESCTDNTYHQLTLVSVSKQRMWMCEGPRQVYSSPVTTGAAVDNDQTPLGSWTVQAKQRDRYLVGAGYRDYVRYWVPFNGDFGFHDASWQTMAFGSPDYLLRGSHGCVHLPTPAMKWLYSWASVGDTVVTVQA